MKKKNMGSGTSFQRSCSDDEDNVKRVCVIGQGYLGTKIAAELVMSGCRVMTVDTYVTDARARNGIVNAMYDIFSESVSENEKKWDNLLIRLNLLRREDVSYSPSNTTTISGKNNVHNPPHLPRDRKIPRAMTMKRCEKAIRKLIDDTVDKRVIFHKSIKNAVSNAQLVVEAVVERLDVKQAVLKQAEDNAPSSCVLATNSMTLSLDSIKTGLSRPNMVIGLRFLSPVVGIPFVEIWGDCEEQSKAMEYAASIMESLEKIVFKYDPPKRTEENKDMIFPRLVLQRHEVTTHRRRAVTQLLRHLETVSSSSKKDDEEEEVISLRWTLGSSLNYVKDKTQMCVVCFERPGTVLILSCGHRILCKQCTLNIQLVNPRCPVCREWIGSTATSLLSSSDVSSSAKEDEEGDKNTST